MHDRREGCFSRGNGCTRSRDVEVKSLKHTVAQAWQGAEETSKTRILQLEFYFGDDSRFDELVKILNSKSTAVVRIH